LPLASPSDDSQTLFSPKTPAETPQPKIKNIPAETPKLDAKLRPAGKASVPVTPTMRTPPAAAEKPRQHIADWDWVRKEAVLTLDGAKHISTTFSQLDPEKGNSSMDMTSFRMYACD
jgi:hypothetical protein